MTSSAGESFKSLIEKYLPLKSGKLKAGAGVPSANICDGVCAILSFLFKCFVY
jgi:hypothetical protein